MTNGNVLKTITVFIVVRTCTAAMATDATGLAMSGHNLSPKDAETLEKKTDRNPHDVASRTKLLGYYFLRRTQTQPVRNARQKHIQWLILNAPESKVLGTPYGHLDAILEPHAYSQGKKAWLDHIKRKPKSLKMLEHSASFFLLHDRHLAEQSLKKGRSLDTNNPKWPAALGHLYSLDMMTNSLKARNNAANKALAQFETAYKLSTEMGRDLLLQRLAKAALEANKPKKAKQYAEKMLRQNRTGWNYGNNIHHGNIILGRIALKSGNVERAKEHLIKAGQTPGSPQLNSFGPNMTLARDLLEKGEKDAVLKYFELCAKFWSMKHNRLDKWSAAVKDGNVPDFGTNLNY